MENIIESMIPVVKSLALAIVVLIVGLIVIKQITKKLVKFMDKTEMDANLKPFLSSLLGVGLKVLLLFAVVGIIGVDTSSFVAVLASMGFAIGLAFQGSLSNFAGGILLLAMRPFKVGDVIESNSILGIVQGIKILYTEVNTFDNKTVFIPNGGLANSSITNYTRNEIRRVDLEFSVSYDSDIEKVKKLLNKIVVNHELTLSEPEPFIKLHKHGASELIFLIRVWAKTDDMWTVHYDLLEQVKLEFDKAKISIPYPQMDVHITNE